MYPYQLKSFIESDLGPLLNQSGFNRDTLKLLILDDSISITNYFWIPLTIDDPLTRRFVSGFAFHWYKNDATTRYILDYLHFKYPHQLMLSTEAAEGYRPGEGNNRVCSLIIKVNCDLFLCRKSFSGRLEKSGKLWFRYN